MRSCMVAARVTVACLLFAQVTEMNDISRHTVSPEAVSQGVVSQGVVLQGAWSQGVVSQAGFRTEGRKGPHQASTSLTPYGMSFWALILAVIEDFDAAGVFNADDFEPLAGVTFAEIQ